MAGPSPLVEHLLRRAGFGLSPAERVSFTGVTYPAAVDALVGFDPVAADVDHRIGTPGFVGITAGAAFQPNTNIQHSRQRWLFRLVHSPAPLQEKMALFWHHHFATAYTKVSGIRGATEGARMMAAKPSEDPGGVRGQLELFRQFALGNFRDLLIAVAQDPAMLVWLDGYLNRKNNPQENFGRELMELFTFGVEHYTEPDVYAAARVFTGWNMVRTGTGAAGRWVFSYVAAEHDTSAKQFSFPIYKDGGRQIPPRAASAGIQDGLDLINALAFHPETARRMARRLWTWFVSEVDAPDPIFVDAIAQVYLRNASNMKPVIRAVLMSPQFIDERRFYQRYAWPTEFVVRALKEVGFIGFSVNDALTPMNNMGQLLFEPPDVAGWELGPEWFSTGRMLARMNFASQLAQNQRFELRNLARPHRASPDTMVDFALDRLNFPPVSAGVRDALTSYVRAGGTWTGSEAQLLNKAGGLFHLLTGSGEYQFM
jgi:uncharacterized protein (DUF1800 family)